MNRYIATLTFTSKNGKTYRLNQEINQAEYDTLTKEESLFFKIKP